MNNDRIIEINIENEMKSSYIDYSMSVIVSRALPDIRFQACTPKSALRYEQARQLLKCALQEVGTYRR